MPKTMREYLPSSLSGGGGSSAPPATTAPDIRTGAVQVSVMSRMTNAMRPASERAGNLANAANMAGLPVAASNDSAFEMCCPKLTFKERVMGCVGCFGIGIIISLLSFVSWWGGNTAGWAILYTIGNCVSLCSSGFLLGFKKQFKNMTRARRRIAAGIYVGMMVVTIVGGFLRWPGPILILCVFIQWCAAIWYIASYIPGGQKLITSVLGRAVNF